MTKAWDVKGLLETLKAQGLPLLEDGAMKVIEGVYQWGKDSIALEKNAIVKALAAPALEAVFGPEGLARNAADKIDGEVG